MQSTSNVPVFCPACHARYEIAVDLAASSDVVLLCGLCGRGFRVRESRAVGRDDATPQTTTGGPRVIVGHEHPGACRTLAAVLRQGGYEPVCLAKGEQVLSAFDAAMPELPSALCLDVGIPGVLAFEVIAHLRANPHTKTLPIILLASVFERTRYKRRPNRLYGADTYLELHHVPDRLIEVLEALRARAPLDDERRQAPLERAAAAPLRDAGDLTGDDALRRRARRTLMDLALYHGDEIGRGLKSGDPFTHLADAVEGARESLLSVALDAARARVIFEEEHQAFVARLTERERSRRVLASGDDVEGR